MRLDLPPVPPRQRPASADHPQIIKRRTGLTNHSPYRWEAVAPSSEGRAWCMTTSERAPSAPPGGTLGLASFVARRWPFLSTDHRLERRGVGLETRLPRIRSWFDSG